MYELDSHSFGVGPKLLQPLCSVPYHSSSLPPRKVPTLAAEGHLYKMQVVWSLSCGTLPIHPVEIIDETDVEFTAKSHQRDSSDNQGLNILKYILEV
jgi:hypothetical protein